MARSTAGKKGICTNPDCSEYKKETTIEYGDFNCPKCGSELTEVKAKTTPKGMIVGIVAAVVLGGGAAWWLVNSLGSSDEPVKEPAVVEQAAETVPADTVTTAPADTVAPVVEPEVQKPAVEEPTAVTPPAPAAPATVTTKYGIYSGPMRGGKPDGFGGTLTFNGTVSIDLKGAGTLVCSKGDKIADTKFKNGVLVSGQYIGASGNQRYIDLGTPND